MKHLSTIMFWHQISSVTEISSPLLRSIIQDIPVEFKFGLVNNLELKCLFHLIPYFI